MASIVNFRHIRVLHSAFSRIEFRIVTIFLTQAMMVTFWGFPALVIVRFQSTKKSRQKTAFDVIVEGLSTALFVLFAAAANAWFVAVWCFVKRNGFRLV